MQLYKFATYMCAFTFISSSALSYDTAGFGTGKSLEEARNLFRELQPETSPLEFKNKYAGDEKEFVNIIATPIAHRKDGIQEKISMFLSSYLSENKVIAVSRHVYYVGVIGPKLNDLIVALRNKYGKPVYEQIPNHDKSKYVTMIWSTGSFEQSTTSECRPPDLSKWSWNKQQKNIDDIANQIDYIAFMRSAKYRCGELVQVEIGTGQYDVDNVRTMDVKIIDYPGVAKAAGIDQAALDEISSKRKATVPRVGVPKL